MAIPFIAFWVLIAIGKSDLGYKKTISFIGIWSILLFGFIYLNIHPYYFVAPQTILDAVLILMIFGRDINIR